jgi:hypothetical protein
VKIHPVIILFVVCLKTNALTQLNHISVASDNGADVWLNDRLVVVDNDDHEYKYWNRIALVDRSLFRVGNNVLSGKQNDDVVGVLMFYL